MTQDTLEWTTAEPKQRKLTTLGEPINSGKELLRMG
jgi:hypothetical protein